MDTCDNFYLQGNTVIQTAEVSGLDLRGHAIDVFNAPKSGGFTSVKITDNSVYGYLHVAFAGSPGPCGTVYDQSTKAAEDKLVTDTGPNPDSSKMTGKYIFANNQAIGGKIGLMMVPWSETCTQLTHFATTFNTQYGILSIYKTEKLIVRQVVITDTRVGIFALTGDSAKPTFRLTHSHFNANSMLGPCFDCYQKADVCSNRIGIQLG